MISPDPRTPGQRKAIVRGKKRQRSYLSHVLECWWLGWTLSIQEMRKLISALKHPMEKLYIAYLLGVPSKKADFVVVYSKATWAKTSSTQSVQQPFGPHSQI